MRDITVSATELRNWLTGFFNHRLRSQTFLNIPNDLYSYLREEGYVDIEHDVTPKGISFLQETQ